MGQFTLLKDLLSFYDNLKIEEEIILCIHALLLDAGLDNIWRETCFDNLPRTAKGISTTEKYLKYGTDKKDEDFCVCKILVNPQWRKEKHNYTFHYVHEKSDKKYILNILNTGSSLVVQLTDPTGSDPQTVTLHVEEFIQDKENRVFPWTNVDVVKLAYVINKEVLVKLGLYKGDECFTNINGNTSYNFMETNCRAHQNKLLETKKELGMEYQQMQNNVLINVGPGMTRFDDSKPFFMNPLDRTANRTSNPVQYMDPENWCHPNEPRIFGSVPQGFFPGNIPPDMLKPDGMLFGPNHKLFGPSHIRYDPMGPFGVEPNND